MARNDHTSTANGAPIARILVAIGMVIIIVGIGGLIYRMSSQDTIAEAGPIATGTATETPETRAETGADDATSTPSLTPTDESRATSPPIIQTRSTATPSPTARATRTPTPEPTPTPTVDADTDGENAATATPEPTQADSGSEPAPDNPADPPPAATAEPEPPGSTVTHIRVPSSGIDTSVVEVGYQLIEIEGQTVIEWDVANWAAGHHSISANPGEGGNVVIAGHVAGSGEVFRTLEQAEVGDEVILSTTEGEFRYEIAEVHLRLEAGAPLEERLAIGSFMDPMPEERVTLITCWPYGVYDHRLIVVAKPV